MVAEVLYGVGICSLPIGTSNEHSDQSYHMAFWHTPFTTESGLTASVREMRGVGGMLVCLMSNGVTGFRSGNGRQ